MRYISGFSVLFCLILLSQSSAFACSEKSDLEKKVQPSTDSQENESGKIFINSNDSAGKRAQLKRDIVDSDDDQKSLEESLDNDSPLNLSKHGRSHLSNKLINKNIR